MSTSTCLTTSGTQMNYNHNFGFIMFFMILFLSQRLVLTSRNKISTYMKKQDDQLHGGRRCVQIFFKNFLFSNQWHGDGRIVSDHQQFVECGIFIFISYTSIIGKPHIHGSRKNIASLLCKGRQGELWFIWARAFVALNFQGFRRILRNKSKKI